MILSQNKYAKSFVNKALQPSWDALGEIGLRYWVYRRRQWKVES